MRVSISLALAASAVVVYSQGLQDSPVELTHEQAAVDSQGDGLRLLQGEALGAAYNVRSRRLVLGKQPNKQPNKQPGCLGAAWCRLSSGLKAVQRLKGASGSGSGMKIDHSKKGLEKLKSMRANHARKVSTASGLELGSLSRSSSGSAGGSLSRSSSFKIDFKGSAGGSPSRSSSF
ncbi:hypothetical protein LEN26_003702 [Aphanomyces euteiches]|nr:hypothetical protein LEN26_019473 [Aphanomyces euteiches]KAH9100367.1 hypothetical protein LEN26_015914 [Aphanomyces euteiches]KAH9123631.1 hypothetical protein AeMF1_005433 [Aphanomyces euteiches]KAH9143226.1 hypothetical protein LEN26_005082 [Aphanomyces euteiches]KAH9152496.1 hypothetical protein LEN26_003702 [Aphanomyces euteiches]